MSEMRVARRPDAGCEMQPACLSSLRGVYGGDDLHAHLLQVQPEHIGDEMFCKLCRRLGILPKKKKKGMTVHFTTDFKTPACEAAKVNDFLTDKDYKTIR
jgi:hypothetical protein